MAPMTRRRAQAGISNDDENTGDRENGGKGDGGKVQEFPQQEEKKGKAKTNNGETARNDKNGRQADASSPTKQGDTIYVASSKRGWSQNCSTDKSDTQECIEVAMPMTKRRRVQDKPTVEDTDTEQGDGDLKMPDAENPQDGNANIEGEEQRIPIAALRNYDFTFSLHTDIAARNHTVTNHTMGGTGSSRDVGLFSNDAATNVEKNIIVLDGMEVQTSGTRQVESDKQSGDINTQKVGSNGMVVATSPQGTSNNEPRNTKLDDMQSSGGVDYPSCETERNKTNSATNIHDVRNGGETRSDVQVNRNISERTRNDEQRNTNLGDMTNCGSVDPASLRVDTERENSDSDMRSDDKVQSQDEVRSDGEVDAAFSQGTKNNDQRNPELDDINESGGSMDTSSRKAMDKNVRTESPLQCNETLSNFVAINPQDTLRRKNLEQDFLDKLEIKHAKILLDMVDSLSNHKADMYYLLALKIILLIFPSIAWEDVQDKLPAMMSYAIGNVRAGLENRESDGVYTEYPSDKGVEERITCWNQRLELYKGIEHGMKRLLEPIPPSPPTNLGHLPSESSALQAELKKKAGDLNHCQIFQEYFSHYASRAGFIFQIPQLLRDETGFVVSILRQMILREKESSDAMFLELEDIASHIVTAREAGVTEAIMRQDVVMDLFEPDTEEITKDNDEKEGVEKRTVGDIRKQRILEDVKETVEHYQSEALNFETKYNNSNKSLSSLGLETTKLRNKIQDMEKDFCQLYFWFFGPAVPPSINNELQKISDIILQKVKTDFNKSYTREQEYSQLLQQLEQAKKEKARLEDKNGELKIQVEGIENSYRRLEAKLLPIDPKNRVIQDWRVENSTRSDEDTQMNDSPGFVGAPMSILPEELVALKAERNTGEDIEMQSFEGDNELNVKSGDGKNADGEKTTEDLRKERKASDKRETIEHSRSEARNLKSRDLDSEKTLKSMNTTLMRENTRLKDGIKKLKKFQQGEIREFTLRLRNCNNRAVELGKKNDEMENDFRLLYFKVSGADLPPSLQKLSDIIWEKLETEFKKRCNIEQEQDKLLEKEKRLTASLEAERRQKEIRIQQLEQKFEKVSQNLRQEQAVNIEAERSKSDIQAQLDAKTQSLSSLEYQFEQAKKEKAWLEDKNGELKTQVEGAENWYKGLEAKLLPIDPKNWVIQDWRVNSSTRSDKDTQTNDSDEFAGDSMPRLKEELATVKAKAKNKEENLKAVEQEKTDLLKRIENLEKDIRTGRDENKTAYKKINELEAQLDTKSMNHQKAVEMQLQIIQLEQEIKSIREKEQSYKAKIEEYENQIKDIINCIETRKEQITEVQQYLKVAETEVREQKQALVKNRQELEAVKAEVCKNEETQESIKQEKNVLEEKMANMKQTTEAEMNKEVKKVSILKVKLQDAKKEVKDVNILLATFAKVNSNLRKELSKIIKGLDKKEPKYQESIAKSNDLIKCLQEVGKEIMNVQNAQAEKDQTISQLRQEIKMFEKDQARQTNVLIEEVRKLNSQIGQEREGDSGVTGKPLPPSEIKDKLKLRENTTESSESEDKSCIILGKLEVALLELESWKESGNRVVESQKRIDNVYSTIESIPSKLEQVLRTHEQSVCDGKVNCAYLQLNPDAQAPDEGILTRLETEVEDLKRSINEQHIGSHGNVETNKLCHSVEEMERLISRVSQLSKESSENLEKEISRLTEQTSRLNSDIEEKDKQYREAIKELRSCKANYETKCKGLNEIIPVLETKELKKQIHELQEQIQALGPKLEVKNQELGTLEKDVYNTKSKTITSQGDIKQRDMNIESLRSSLSHIMSKLDYIERTMTKQQQGACDEKRNPSQFTSPMNAQMNESDNFSKLESQVNNLNHIIVQLREENRFMAEVQKLQSRATERDYRFNDLKDKMDRLIPEVGKLQSRINDSEAEVQGRQDDMGRFVRLSTNTWINRKLAEEAVSKPNENHDPRKELDGLRDELSLVENNILYYTSTFPPVSGQALSAAMEERFLGKVPVTERLRLLVERVRHRIDGLQSSLEQAKLDYARVVRPERTRSAFIPDENEIVTPSSELNMEFSTPMENTVDTRESGAIQSPNDQRKSRSLNGKHNTDTSHGRHMPLSNPVSTVRPCVTSASTQTGIQEASKELTVDNHDADVHASTDSPVGLRKPKEDYPLGSDSVHTDLERLRASLTLHLCTMLFAKEETLDVERLRDRKGIFARRHINKDLELLKKVIKGYSKPSMKYHGANAELRKITFKGRKAFPEALLSTYKTIFKTLLTLAQPFDTNDLVAGDDNKREEATCLGKSRDTTSKEKTHRKRRFKPSR